MTRYTRPSHSLKDQLERDGVKVFLLDGRVGERERLPIVTPFSTTEGAVLILTRNTGRRGLDLPSGDYAIFYSPKDDEFTMWQELSRIRSTLSAKGFLSSGLLRDNGRGQAWQFGECSEHEPAQMGDRRAEAQLVLYAFYLPLRSVLG